MEHSKSIIGIDNCYGCGVCAVACGKNIIEIRLNHDGFYEPVILEPNKCSNCGLCVDICAYNHKELSLQDFTIKSYAAWSKDPAVRRKCSSGGVGFEVGKTIIDYGGKVCVVRYNAEKNLAEHYVASTYKDLIPSIGSKYIQSYTVGGIKEIINLVRDAKRKGENSQYLVTGTPCQIDSFRRYLQRFHLEDNFLLLDFFCHGVPSKLMWNKYVDYVEKKVGKLTYVSWRNKLMGWHDSYAMAINGKKCVGDSDSLDDYDSLIKVKKCAFNSQRSQGDLFYKLFLSNACLGKACYDKCKYKYNHSSADVRIGDAWGKTFKDDEEGVNSVIVFTQRGKDLLENLNCAYVPYPYEIIAEGQMHKKLRKPFYRYIVLAILKSPLPLWNALFVAQFFRLPIILKYKLHL